MKKQKKKIPAVKKEIKLLNKVLNYAKTLKSKYKGAAVKNRGQNRCRKYFPVYYTPSFS